MVSATITIEPMAVRHIAQVAGIHGDELGEDFLPSLGRGFLVRGFYPAMLNNPHACVLVALDASADRVAGFVNIATDPARYLSWCVRRTLLELSASMLRLLFTQPQRVVEAFAIARNRIATPEGAGEIAFIAVDRAHQQQGIGQMMVDAANLYLYRHRLTRCFTKTLARNEHVITFYRKKWGAELFSTTAILGKRYVVLVWDVPNH